MRNNRRHGSLHPTKSVSIEAATGNLFPLVALADLNAGRYDDAKERLMQWDMTGGKVCSALLIRGQAEAAL